MTNAHDPKTLPDDELLLRLSDLVRRSRRVEAVLVTHIAEVDHRRLYLRDAPSMFVFCTQVLHLSEHEAYARITVARAARRRPVLLEMLGDGRLHLSGIAKLVPHLTDANATALLARAAHRTKGEIDALLAEIAPKSDVAATMRLVPVRRLVVVDSATPTPRPPSGELGLDRVGRLADTQLFVATPSVSDASPRPDEPVAAPPAHVPPPPIPAPAVTTLSPGRYKIQFTAPAALRDGLERLQSLLRADLATVIEAAVTEKLERLDAKRFGLTRAPRRTLDDADLSGRSRYVPAAVRRAVRVRDGDQCTFRLGSGRRCPERRGLEFHHREPYGRGGNHHPDNVCLMCRPHNAHVAERDYGKAHMARYRSPAARASGGGRRADATGWSLALFGDA